MKKYKIGNKIRYRYDGQIYEGVIRSEFVKNRKLFYIIYTGKFNEIKQIFSGNIIKRQIVHIIPELSVIKIIPFLKKVRK